MKAATRRTMRVVLLATFAAAAVTGDKCPFFSKKDPNSDNCISLNGFTAQWPPTMTATDGLVLFAGLTRKNNICSAGFATGRICTATDKSKSNDDTCKGKELYTFENKEAVEGFEPDCGSPCEFAIDAQTYTNECSNAAQMVPQSDVTLQEGESFPAQKGDIVTYNGMERTVFGTMGGQVQLQAECCDDCYTGYTYDAALKMCRKNKCTCEGGTSAEGEACTTDGAEICSACDEGEGFVLKAQEDVAIGEVTWTDIEAPTGDQQFSTPQVVDYNGRRLAIDIKSSGTQVTLAGGTCKKKKCNCEFGDDVEGADCKEDGAKVCYKSNGCAAGYSFTENRRRLLEESAAPSEQPTNKPSAAPTAAPTEPEPVEGTCTANTCQCDQGVGVEGTATVTYRGDETETVIVCANAGDQTCKSCTTNRALGKDNTCKQTVDYVFEEGDGGNEYVKGTEDGGAFVGDIINVTKLKKIDGYGCAKGFVPREDLSYVVKQSDADSGKVLDLDATLDIKDNKGNLIEEGRVCIEAFCNSIVVDEQNVGGGKNNDATVNFGNKVTYTCAAGYEAQLLQPGVGLVKATQVEYECKETEKERVYELESHVFKAGGAVCKPMQVSYTYNNGLKEITGTGAYNTKPTITCADGYGQDLDSLKALTPDLGADGQPEPVPLTGDSLKPLCFVWYGDIVYGLEGGEAYSPPNKVGARSGDTFEYVCPNGYVLNAAYDEQTVKFTKQFDQYPGEDTIVCDLPKEESESESKEGAVVAPGIGQTNGVPSGAKMNNGPQASAGMGAESFRVNMAVNKALDEEGLKPEVGNVGGLEPLHIVLIVGGALLIAGCLIWFGIVRTESGALKKRGYNDLDE